MRGKWLKVPKISVKRKCENEFMIEYWHTIWTDNSQDKS